MRCRRCQFRNLNSAICCMRCGRHLTPPSVEPGWVCLFVLTCGLIPVFTLGGWLWITIGFCGGIANIVMSRLVVSDVLRFVLCSLLTASTWILFIYVYEEIQAESGLSFADTWRAWELRMRYGL